MHKENDAVMNVGKLFPETSQKQFAIEDEQDKQSRA